MAFDAGICFVMTLSTKLGGKIGDFLIAMHNIAAPVAMLSIYNFSCGM